MFKHHITHAVGSTDSSNACAGVAVHTARSGTDELTVNIDETSDASLSTRAAVVVRGSMLRLERIGDLVLAHVRGDVWTWVSPPRVVAISCGRDALPREQYTYPFPLEHHDLIVMASEDLNAALPRELIVEINARERINPARALVAEAEKRRARGLLLAVCITFEGISMRGMGDGWPLPSELGRSNRAPHC